MTAVAVGYLAGQRGHYRGQVTGQPRPVVHDLLRPQASAHTARLDAGPARVEDGVPVGYADTPAGAAAAAVNYLGALAGPQLLDPGAYAAILRRITTPAGYETLSAQAAAGRPEALQNLGVGRAPAPQLIIRSAPLGYRIDAYRRNGATVSVWSVGVVGSSTTRPPDATWSTTTVVLAWSDGDWRMRGYRSVPGPVPPQAASQVPSPASDLFAASPQFKRLGYAHP